MNDIFEEHAQNERGAISFRFGLVPRAAPLALCAGEIRETPGPWRSDSLNSYLR